ncbi:AMP-binding enzyme [uncultured archaeon]|nr:AMP-binding enzyme [uncultured archaeon]
MDQDMAARRRLLLHFDRPASGSGFWKDTSLSSKDDIRTLATPANFAEVRITSGSTGEPLYVFYSQGAVRAFIDRTIVTLKKLGVSRSDTVLNLLAYGNFVPGSMYERACNEAEIPILALGTPNTHPMKKTLDAIEKARPTVWLAMPSYALKLLDALESSGRGPLPREVMVTSERLLDSYVGRFRHFGIELRTTFGLTECPAIGVSKPGDAMTQEVIGDGAYVEAVDVNGATELAVTDLNNLSTPVIRYLTGDVIKNIKYGDDGSVIEFVPDRRNDDLIKINGILVSKSALVEALSKYSDDFTVRIETRNDSDFLEVTFPKKCESREAEIRSYLSSVRVNKDIVFKTDVDVPVTGSGKLRHLVDRRA